MDLAFWLLANTESAKGVLPRFREWPAEGSAAMCVSAVRRNCSPLHSRNLGKTLLTDSEQSGASGEGLGRVDLDLGCSTILLGQ